MVDPPSFFTDGSKPWICCNIQRLEPPPARIMDFERISATITQRKEEEEKSPAAGADAANRTQSPASLLNTATQTDSASPGTRDISVLPQERGKKNLMPSPPAQTGKPPETPEVPSPKISTGPSRPRRRPPESQQHP
ncbi:unnamed protein product [Urochloa humidicola]